jgi:hypothetical protein
LQLGPFKKLRRRVRKELSRRRLSQTGPYNPQPSTTSKDNAKL